VWAGAGRGVVVVDGRAYSMCVCVSQILAECFFLLMRLVVRQVLRT
jgi:hypothetical protein